MITTHSTVTATVDDVDPPLMAKSAARSPRRSRRTVMTDHVLGSAHAKGRRQ